MVTSSLGIIKKYSSFSVIEVKVTSPSLTKIVSIVLVSLVILTFNVTLSPSLAFVTS